MYNRPARGIKKIMIMAKYIQDMSVGALTDMLESYIKKQEKTGQVELKTMAVGRDTFDVTLRAEDSLESQLVMVEAEVNGHRRLYGIEWSPELKGIFGHWFADKK